MMIIFFISPFQCKKMGLFYFLTFEKVRKCDIHICVHTYIIYMCLYVFKCVIITHTHIRNCLSRTNLACDKVSMAQNPELLAAWLG